MGILTYVADHLDNSPAKKFASYPLKIDGFDIQSLYRVIEDQQIDGVLVGCADILVPSYQKVCELANKPCYLTKDIVEIFANKKNLKRKLCEFGLPTIPEYNITNETSLKDLDDLSYPVLLKPVDNNSSKGMSVCYNRDEVKDAYNIALSYSRSKTVLVEKYMTCDDITVSYVFQNGIPSVTTIGDRYVNREQANVGTITSAVIYPSRHSQLYFDTIHDKMCKLFSAMGIKNGILSIQGFVENNKIMFYDPALRITGCQYYVLVKHFCDVDLLEYLITFAITGSTDNICLNGKVDSYFGGKIGANLVISVKTGVIKEIIGVDKLRSIPGIINITQEHFPGDEIRIAGTANQNIMRLHAVAKEKADMQDIMRKVQSCIKVYDGHENDMLLKQTDPEVI